MVTPLWARLDVPAFVVLAEVVRSGSFTAAARSLGYSQSAVSQQIGRLEQTLGHRVVNRSAGGRTISLTPAGRILMAHADALLSTLQAVATDVAALSAGTAGVLRVGSFESVGVSLLPATVARFAEAFPKVRVELTELFDDAELLQRVATDDLDLTFVVYPLTDGPFEAQALLADPYVLVTAPNATEPGPGPVDLDEYPDLRLMVYAELRPVHSIESRLGHPGYGERVVFRSNHNSTLLSLAAQGYAAAVVPALGVQPGRADVRVQTLSTVSPRIVGLARHRNRPLADAAATFIDCAKAASAQLRQTQLT